jgi:methionyl-tRNA formyltransferase
MEAKEINHLKYVFIGNRSFVLKEMLNKKLNILHCIVMKDSYLEREIESFNIASTTINSKAEMHELLHALDFDVLISNGCSYIINVNSFSKSKIFINIHPSFLPDLKGKDPIIGAICFKRDTGATCHIMDEGIDTGEIIAQVKIPFSYDLDAGLLYQLSFIAEQKVFNEAYARAFAPHQKQNINQDLIYYSYQEKDRYISLDKSADSIIQKSKALSNLSKGSVFLVNEVEYIFFSAAFVTNSFFVGACNNFSHLQIVLVFEKSIIFKFNEELIRLDNIVGDLSKIKIGSKISSK